MLKELFRNYLLIGALAFFIFCVGGSLLYMQHVKQVSEKELAVSPEQIKQWDERQEQQPPGEARSYKGMPQQSSATSEGTAQPIGVSKEGPIGTYETPEEQVESIFTEITAEEEKAEEALSAEEVQKREFQKRFKEIYKEIEAIVAAAGGKITAETHPEEMQKVARLQKEILQMMLEGGDDPTVRDLIAVTDARQRFQNRLSAAGEIRVSEAFEIADFIETELGNQRGAEGIRTLAQYAIDNGSDVITQEHFDAEYGQN